MPKVSPTRDLEDVKGFRNSFLTGDDQVDLRNVFGIALVVPNAALRGSPIRIWARNHAILAIVSWRELRN